MGETVTGSGGSAAMTEYYIGIEIPKYHFGMEDAYRLPKLNYDAAELPRYRHAD